MNCIGGVRTSVSNPSAIYGGIAKTKRTKHVIVGTIRSRFNREFLTT